jgi:nucleotide-binding universal stress UspA family protein
MKADKILIVADDSAPSTKAIQYGFELAIKLGAKVTLLSVVEPGHALGNPDAGIFPDDALIVLKEKTKEFLNRVKSDYGSGIDIDLMSPVGDIQPTVIAIAVKLGADLIVAGTHGRTGLSKLFSGSVAESIIHHSPVPVVIVPMDK